jgi:hypothetical protein
MLLRNEFTTDPRAKKMATTISNCGYVVDVMSFVNIKRVGNYIEGKVRVNYFSSGVETAKKVVAAHGDIVKGNNKTIDRTFLAFIYIMYLNVKFTYYFLRYMNKKNIKCIHANDLDTLPAAYIISRITGSKLVYDAHELFNELYSDYTHSLKVWLKLLEGWLMPRCDATYTVNSDIAEVMRDRYGVLPEVVMNCPYYCTVTRTRTGVHEPYIIYLGSYQEERCIESVIKSIKWWENHDWKLFLRGWGGYENYLRRIAREFTDDTECVFLEPVPTDKIVESLVEFDIGIIPYPPHKTLNNKYSSPNKIFEYMMAGVVPIVPYGSVTMEHIVDEIGVNVRFESCVDHSIAIAIDTLICDPQFGEYRERCLELAKNKYNWGSQCLPVIGFYSELI